MSITHLNIFIYLSIYIHMFHINDSTSYKQFLDIYFIYFLDFLC